MTEQEAREQEIRKLVLRQRVCEETLAYRESKQEGPDLTLTIDRIFTAIELAGYLLVEEVEPELLSDEEIKRVFEEHKYMTEDGYASPTEEQLQAQIDHIRQQCGGKIYSRRKP